jgi:hypothetical protein
MAVEGNLIACRVPQVREVLLPSGVPVGEPIGPVLLNQLQAHAEVPKAYHPVIEDGTYDEFKECIFRVCSLRGCEVLLADFEAECRGLGIELQLQRRHWFYARNTRCLTMVEVRMLFGRTPVEDLESFLDYLSRRYEFVYNRLCVSHARRSSMAMRDYAGVTEVEVSAELTWPYWM